MLDFVLDIISQIFIEIIPQLLKLIGATLRWIYYLGKKKYKEILKEEWNLRIGLLFIIIVFFLLIKLI